MKHPAIYLFSIVSLIFVSFQGFGQNPPVKFGDVSKEELTMTDYEKEPGAPAVILFDFNVIDIDYSNGEFGVRYNHTRRLKILKKEGYDWATFTIPLYNKDNYKEIVTGLKGFTYNLVNNKIEKTKLDKSSVFNEKVNDNRDEIKFTMPDVKEGSVIEFTYVKSSDFLSSIDAWSFQKSIPVAYSELYFKVPEFFNYLHITGGFESFAVADKKTEPRTVTEFYTQRTYARNTIARTSYGSGSASFNVNIDHFLAKDMPSLKDEKYVGNLDDYRQKIEFQLASTNFNGVYKDILGTWESINERFTEDVEDFGPNMVKKGFYQDALDQILSQVSTPVEKAMAITDFLTRKMKWNSYYNYMPDKNIKKVFDDRGGSSADINALLVSMLRAAGLDAEPVIISTRAHGQINPAYPLLNKYNNLIAAVWINDEILLLDATDPDVPPGILPENCLNRTGRCISEKHSTWINLEPAEIYNRISMGNLSLDGDKLSGNMIIKHTGYAAINARSSLRLDGEDKYIENVKKNNPSWEILDHSIENDEEKSPDVKEKYQIELTEAIMNTGDLIYIDPIIINRLDENPLKNETRKFPVDFGEPIKEQYILNITIPESYTVEELPESLQYSLPDQSASFRYLAQVQGYILQVSTNLEIKKGFYLSSEYKSLREFMGMVVQKNNEQVVLKRNVE